MKKTILLLFTLLFMFIGLNTIEAKPVNVNVSAEVQLLDPPRTNTAANRNTATNRNTGTQNDAQCKSLFGNPKTKGTLAYYLQFALEVIKYLGIVLCIVLTVVDFAKALLGEEKEMYKPLAKKGFSRLIYACLLFFLPILVKVVLELVGVYGTCGIG